MKVILLRQRLVLLSVLLLSPFFSFSQQSRLIIPFGHQKGIRQSLFSHDNKMLITAGDKLTIVYDVRTGHPLSYMMGGKPSISAKDDYIATTIDTLVMIWSLSTGTIVNSLTTAAPVARLEFNPENNLLLIEQSAGIVSIWDIAKKQAEHDFGSDEKKENCKECNASNCHVIGGWFTPGGDSVKVVYNQLLKTFAIGNYNASNYVCLKRPAKADHQVTTTILNDHIVRQNNDEEAWCFDQNGVYRRTWTYKKKTDFTKLTSGNLFTKETEYISPAFNYALTYNARSIHVWDMVADSGKIYEVLGGMIKKMTFNKAGTHVLVEYLNEPPRVLLASNFSTMATFNQAIYEGLPTYVYKTKTAEDIEKTTAAFDSIEIKMAPNSKGEELLNKTIGLPTKRQLMAQGVTMFQDDMKNISTNSGEIVNLANNRTICKIESLIKQTGSMKLSPDGKIMLLNTGKLLSLYSIPYAKILLNIKCTSPYHAFSPDSRWMVQYVPGKTVSICIINITTGDVKSVPVTIKTNTPTFAYSPDSKQVTLSAAEGGYVAIDLARHELIKPAVANISYYASPNGEQYGLVNTKEHTVQLFNAKGNYTFKPGSGTDYRITFSKASNAVAVWTNQQLIYIRDLEKINDTLVFADKGVNISKVNMSANGKYISMQMADGTLAMLNTANKDLSFGLATAEKKDFNVAESFRSMMTGNIDDLISTKERAQFSTTGDSVMVCEADSAVIYSCATGERLNAFKADGQIKYFSFSNNLLVAYHYGQLKFYHLFDKEEWFSMVPFMSGETVFMTPNGLYSGNKSVTRHLGYMSGTKALSYKQLDFSNNRPDSVLRTLGNKDVKYLAIYDSSVALRRRREGWGNAKNVSFEQAPAVVINNEKTINGEVKQKDLPLQLSVNGKADKLAIFINGNPLNGSKGIKLLRKDTTIHLTLTEGNNNIEISAFDANGREGYRQPLYVTYAPDTAVKKNIYFIGIGAAQYKTPGMNLSYAKNDVTDVLDSLQEHYGNRVIAQTFFDNQATLANLKSLRGKLLTTNPDDIVIVYYSGHGKIEKQKAAAYFGTYDMDFDSPSKNGIAISDFNELLDNIPSRNKVVFLDACHSGEINKNAWTSKQPNTSGPQVAMVEDSLAEVPEAGASDPFDVMLDMFTDLYQGNGTNIVVASKGLEKAKECNEVKHGIFTYAVLQGITQLTADVDSNAMLTIGELQNYVVRNVVFFSKICNPRQVQRASTRKENEFNDWVVIKNDDGGLVRRSVIHETKEKLNLVTGYGIYRDVNKKKTKFLDKDTPPEEKLDIAKKAVGTAWGKLGIGKKGDVDVLKKYQGQSKHPSAVPLVTEAHYTVSYELVQDDKVIFDIFCSGLIPSIQADIDSNGMVDPCKDKVFQQVAGGNELSAQYLVNTAQCIGQTSAGKVLSTGDEYLFIIPLSELGRYVNFVFHSNNMKEVHYFPKQEEENVLKTTLKMEL